MNYILRHDEESGRFAGVTRAADGAQIPADPANADYAAFLAWNSEQVPPLDLSDRSPLTDSRRLERTRAAALTGLLLRADDIGIAVRATIAALTFLTNNRLELIDAQLRALGQPGLAVPRVLQSEIIGYLMQNPTAGDPLPPPEP